jgi:hypothetical protein
VTAISVIVIIIAYLLFTNVFTRVSDTVVGVVSACISVFVWVSIWGPMEKLLFDWVQPHMENEILRKLPMLDIIVRPKS